MEILEELKEKTEQEAEETPAADFFMGIVLMVLSTVVCYVAWSWPEATGIASSAALFPFVYRLHALSHGAEHLHPLFQEKGLSSICSILQCTSISGNPGLMET